WAHLYLAFAFMLALGVAFGLPQPLTLAWALNITDRQNMGGVIGLRLTSNRLAQVVMPTLSGSVATVFGFSAFFFVSSAFLAAATFALIRANTDGQDGV
ncbi:MAG: hypothetical protein WBA28_05495, partial [Microbacteriaceae bacterium]